MNLSSDTSTQSEQVQNVAYRPGRSNTMRSTQRSPSAPAITAVNTSVAMTITPASAASSTATSSNNASPSQVGVVKSRTMPTRETAREYTRSPPSYPSPSIGTVASAVPNRTWSDRSPSPHNRNLPQGAMAEAMAANRSPGIMRRLSRGASDRLRRRTSQQQSMRMRDLSAGPVLVRRRSDSNATSEVGQDMSDLELDPTKEETAEYAHPPVLRHQTNGLGISVGRVSSTSAASERTAPAMSAILQAGTWVTKTSLKNKRKRIKIWLDPNSARVCWHPTTLSKSFFIDDVREVRVGAQSRNARDDAQIADEDEGRFVTIVYEPLERSKGKTIKTMHLIMDSEMVVDYWTEALGNVARERIEIMSALTSSLEKSERGMARAWTKALSRPGRRGPDDLFTLDDAFWLCQKLEINCSASAVKTHFMRSLPRADPRAEPRHESRNDLPKTEYEPLNYTQYVDFVSSFKERKDIHNLFSNISCGTDNDVRQEDFFTFLRTDQKVDVEKDRPYWESVFERFSRIQSNRPALPDATIDPSERTMSMQGLQSFLTSGYNPPLVGSKGEPTFDRPLNEYFISSSHNTYLLGRQVAGASSVEGYISALIKGCRCIEIDCWDGDAGRPMVTHGRTMTTKVPFEDCVSTIARYAFHSSAYPLIVSLEVHCNPEQQRTMVEIMLKHWKGPLVEEPLTNDAVSLPSPEELKNRILVKVKMAEAQDTSSLSIDTLGGRSRARSLGSTLTRTPSTDKFGVSAPRMNSPPPMSASDTSVNQINTPRDSISGSIYTPPSTSSDDSDDVLTPSEKARKPKSSKIIPELGKLGVYVQGIKIGASGFHLPEAKMYNHILSFSENVFNSLCAKNRDTKAQLEQHNLRHLMRVYPGAKRITSSNFDPLNPWRRGVQMVALNWQTFDVHQQMNEAMFAASSDRVGYVLKPEELRPAKHLPITDTLPEGQEMKQKRGKKFVRFSVEIKSAQRLPRPRSQVTDAGMNPWIELEMYHAEDRAPGLAQGYGGMDASAPNGVSGIGSPLRKRTKTLEGNGFDPIWNTNFEMTCETKYPSLIFVRWLVWNSPDGRQHSANSTLLATFTAKLSSLQEGYRHLPLFTPFGEQFREAKLFVKIRKEAPVALQHDGTTNGYVTDSGSSPRPEIRHEPRPEQAKTERSWRHKLLSRTSSQRRLTERQQLDAGPGVISRTSSADRDITR